MTQAQETKLLKWARKLSLEDLWLTGNLIWQVKQEKLKETDEKIIPRHVPRRKCR